jgi:uncharacterized protein YjiS (DUF1127 family)
MRSQTTLGPLRAAQRPTTLPFAVPLHADHTKRSARALLRRLARLIRVWRERVRSRRRLRALSHLDDHLLHDIGLTREALLSEAAKPFWR